MGAPVVRCICVLSKSNYNHRIIHGPYFVAGNGFTIFFVFTDERRGFYWSGGSVMWINKTHDSKIEQNQIWTGYVYVYVCIIIFAFYWKCAWSKWQIIKIITFLLVLLIHYHNYYMIRKCLVSWYVNEHRYTPLS